MPKVPTASRLLQHTGDHEAADLLKQVSPVAWQHINLGWLPGRRKKGLKPIEVTRLISAAEQLIIPKFTLSKLLEEIDRWLTAGQSIFEQELQNLKASRPPPQPLLDPHVQAKTFAHARK